MFDLAITGGTIVTAERLFAGDVYVQGGRIAAVSACSPAAQPGGPAAPSALPAKETIDATGLQVFPGAVDVHSHFQVPGYTRRETFETGSRAAAAGGVTCVVDMPLNNDPPVINAEAFELKREQIAGTAYTDYALWGGLVDDNYDKLDELWACGVAAYKAFLPPVKEGAFTGIDLWQLLRAMRRLAARGALIGLHCEDASLLAGGRALALAEGRTGVDDFLAVHTPLAEWIAVSNAIALCRDTGCQTHICHVSHPDVAELIRSARREGLPVTAETCPHYLGFTEETLRQKGPSAKCTPPLRSAEARDRLWDYLLDGTLSIIASDHSPAEPHEKLDEGDFWKPWGGMNAVQFMFQYTYDLVVTKRGHSPCLLARALSREPAKRFGLWPKKGEVAPGFDADLVLVDPNKAWRITAEDLLTKHPVSAFIGEAGIGAPVLTLLRGVATARDGMYCRPAMGRGRYVGPEPGSR